MGRFEAPSEKKDEAEEPEEGKQREVSFQMAAFDQDQMGEVQYGNAGQWLQSVISQLRPEGLPAEDGDASFFSGSSDSANDGPVQEATPENWDTVCPDSNRICVLALVDGSEEGSISSAVETMELAKAKEKAMLSYSVVDATCHADLAGNLGIDASRLPTVVAMSRSRRKYVDHVGIFSDKSVLSFVRGVKLARSRFEGFLTELMLSARRIAKRFTKRTQKPLPRLRHWTTMDWIWMICLLIYWQRRSVKLRSARHAPWRRRSAKRRRQKRKRRPKKRRPKQRPE